jgi:hypothetical protein
VIGPGDKPKIHNDDEEIMKEQDAEKTGDLGSMVIMPPSITRETIWLVTTVYRAEHLPQMDDSNLLTKGGIDAYLQVEFAGGKPLRTKVKSLKGERAALNPEFYCELWYPITVPTATQQIKYSMWDRDLLSANELLATCYAKFGVVNGVPDKKLDPHWINFWGKIGSVKNVNHVVSHDIRKQEPMRRRRLLH